jgi:cell division protein FtsI (penicillin-binding protein 3)
VPHDQPLKTKKEMQVAQKESSEEAPSESTPDLTAMFDDVNSLPADDPLRGTANAKPAGVDAGENAVTTASKTAGDEAMKLSPSKKVMGASADSGDSAGDLESPAPMPRPIPAVKGKDAVVVNAGLRVPVPSFEGAALRSVVEKADAVGLRVQAVGSGLAREQVPVAGTIVPAGTEVVVRFTR